MAHEDVVPHEEEDLGTAMQKLQIPFNELEKLPIDSIYGFADGIKEIIEDSNLLLEDAGDVEDRSHNGSIDASNNLLRNSLNSRPTAKRGQSLAPKQSRNKRGGQKRRGFESAACLFDSKGDKSCSHCGTRRTPLWREGPRGAGTLCNACGMRYRTGRLLPEYRPASSPDFKPNIHSNFHRKVMEIRRERKLPPTSFGSEGFQH